MLLGAFNQARFVRDARLKFEENLYLHLIIESIYVTQKVTVDDFLLYFANGMSLLSVTTNPPAYWDYLAWYCFSMLNVLVKSLFMLIPHCPEIFWE